MVTITDHDWRPLKVDSQTARNGKFSVDTHFRMMDNIGHYYNCIETGSAFAISSFDIVVPHPLPPGSPLIIFPVYK